MYDAQRIMEIAERRQGDADVTYLLDLVAHSGTRMTGKTAVKLEAWSFIGRLIATVPRPEKPVTIFRLEHIVEALRAHGMPKDLVADLLADEPFDVHELHARYRFYMSKRTMKLVRCAKGWAWHKSVGFNDVIEYLDACKDSFKR